MDAEILCECHAPSKCRSLPTEMRAALFPENSNEKKNHPARDGAHGRSVGRVSLGDEEFSTMAWVRSRSGATSEASAKYRTHHRPLQMSELTASCDQRYLAKLVQSQPVVPFDPRATK